VSARAEAPAGQTRIRRRSLLGQLSGPLRSFLGTESGSAGLLLAATAVAVAWANSPLSEQYVRDYLSARFHHSVADSPLPGLIHRRTAGNPLFVVNVADHLLQQGVVRENAGGWHVHGDQTSITESVPDSLRQTIVRQVERLPVAVQQLLEVASIVGVDFSAAAVAAGLQVAVEEVDQQCAVLARHGQFIHARGIEEWPDHTLSECYSFQHALYQAVLAERVTETQQVRIHRRVGERKALAYDKEVEEIAAELAVHFEKGRDLTRAVHYLGKAGETAMRRSALCCSSRTPCPPASTRPTR